jgi:hypothetical protein
MSKNKVFQWILYFLSQNIVLKKNGIFFMENFKWNLTMKMKGYF